GRWAAAAQREGMRRRLLRARGHALLDVLVEAPVVGLLLVLLQSVAVFLQVGVLQTEDAARLPGDRPADLRVLHQLQRIERLAEDRQVARGLTGDEGAHGEVGLARGGGGLVSAPP